MFIPAHNTDLKVRHTGEVWNRDNLPVEIKQNAVGDLYVESYGKEHLVKELVVAHHGEPPKKCRYPSGDEEVIHLDGDKTNCHIDNLIIREKQKTVSASDLTDEHKKRIVSLVKDKVKYDEIIKEYAEKGVTLSAPQITKIKKEALKGK